jgi:hypothetical protein
MIPIALALRDDGAGKLSGDSSAGTTTSVVVAAAPTTTVVAIPITAAAVAPAPAPAPAAESAGADDSDDAGGGASADQVAAVEQPACAGTYTVVFNDYWNRFPKSSGASVEEWLTANNATHATPLYVGDELCIPEGATAPAPAPTTTAAPETTAAPPPPASTVPPTPATTAAAPPTTPPAAPTTPPAPPLDAAAVEALIREIWPDELEERALTIARRESGLRPDAYNGWCCYGLFQIHFEANRSFLATLGVTSAGQLLDARTNAQVAYAMYQRSGWSPWRSTDPGD